MMTMINNETKLAGNKRCFYVVHQLVSYHPTVIMTISVVSAAVEKSCIKNITACVCVCVWSDHHEHWTLNTERHDTLCYVCMHYYHYQIALVQQRHSNIISFDDDENERQSIYPYILCNHSYRRATVIVTELQWKG